MPHQKATNCIKPCQATSSSDLRVFPVFSDTLAEKGRIWTMGNVWITLTMASELPVYIYHMDWAMGMY